MVRVRGVSLPEEERIAAAAAAAAAAVVKSESVKWRARAERLERERKEQMIKRAELHDQLAEAERLLREVEVEVEEERVSAGVQLSDGMDGWTAELLGHKATLQVEREEVREREVEVNALRQKMAELEQMVREEGARRDLGVGGGGQEEGGEEGEEYCRRLRLQLSEVEAQLQRKWRGEGGEGGSEKGVATRLMDEQQLGKDVAAQQAVADSLRCVWRELSWRLAWGVLHLSGRGGSGEGVAAAEEQASTAVIRAREEMGQEAERSEDGAADWAAAMERDAFETALMEHEKAADEEARSPSSRTCQAPTHTNV
ncbi:MAG: hypothetical protein SGPRY_003808 [Prymnesium sp.]